MPWSIMLVISRLHGEPVGPVNHHLHDPNIYFHWRKSCWPPCCSWMVKGNYRMQRLPPLVPALDCGTWLWWRSISWECAPPGDQHLLQTAAGDIHEREELLLEYLAKSLCDFFFFASAGITWIWVEVSSDPNNSSPKHLGRADLAPWVTQSSPVPPSWASLCFCGG